MIKGTGIDLVEIRRIRRVTERHGQHFISKILTKAEMDQLPASNPVPRIAALFAGKEAAVKALGTGFAQGIHFTSVEILHEHTGKPSVQFHGKAQELVKAMGVTSAQVSLTHEKTHAAAVVILES